MALASWPPLSEPQFPLRRDATPSPVVVVSRLAQRPVPGSVWEPSGAQPWRGFGLSSHFYSMTLGKKEGVSSFGASVAVLQKEQHGLYGTVHWVGPSSMLLCH